MTDLPPHEYRARAAELGRDPAITSRALQLAADIQTGGAAAVLTLGELAFRAGAPSRYLRAIVDRPSDPYLDITRRKKNGTTRPIASPEPILMDTQRWILRHMLPPVPSHHSSWAYRSGRSAVDCAKQHVGARWLVKLDVHDFFASVDERRVFRTFRALKYPPLLSFELSRLCTRPVGMSQGWFHENEPHPRQPLGSLPQGAPTSGALANAMMFDVDVAVAGLAAQHSLTYTRYSDDLVLSGSGAFSRGKAAGLVAKVEVALARNGFRPHRRKTLIAPPGARKVVLGLLLSDDRVSLTPQFKSRIETHVRGVDKFGLVAHAQHRGFRSIISMIEHVDGCIAYAHDVDEVFAAAAGHRWSLALRSDGFPDAPG